MKEMNLEEADNAENAKTKTESDSSNKVSAIIKFTETKTL